MEQKHYKSEVLDEDLVAGYSFEDIIEGVGKAEQIIDDFDIDEPYWIKPYTDFDGPVKTRDTGEEQYHEGVREAFDIMIEDENILNPGIISGRGTGYLLGQLDKLDISEVDVAGEMGAAYFLREDLEAGSPSVYDASFVIPESEECREDIYSFNLTMFEHLADHNLQLMYGDNLSNVTGSACIEAYGVNLEDDRFSVEDTVYEDINRGANAENVKNDILNYSEGENLDLFEFYTDKITFDKSLEAAEIITDAFISNPFTPWGFHDEGDSITMFPKYLADLEFGRDEFEDFVDSVQQDHNRNSDSEFWTSTYHDHSFDFGKRGYENLKTQAAETILEQKNISDPVIPTNTGDKSTDILDMPESIFFAQKNTEAERHCEKNDIPYVEVDDVVESFLIQSELGSRSRGNVF